MNRPVAALADNPIFVKHFRSRLRKPLLLPAVTVVVVLQLLLAWYGATNVAFSNQSVFTINLVLQAVLLVVVGAQQVGATVGSARESGILDFHRISPLGAWTITLGFFFGAPLLQYVLYGVTLPMSLFCAVAGGVTFLNVLEFVVATLLAAWLLHAVSMLSALSARRNTKGGTIGVIVVILVFAMNAFSYMLFRAPQLNERLHMPFFGVELPWLLFSAIYLVPAIAFALIASRRKIRSERAKPLSKRQAIGFLATAAALLLGGVWRVGPNNPVVLTVVYVLTALALFMTLTITPSVGEYARGVRRAAKLGRANLSPWDDLSLNRLAHVCLCTVVLVGASLTWNCVEGRTEAGVSYSLSIAVAVLTVAYFGLAYQYFSLVMTTRAGVMLALMLFLLWGVPAIGASIAAAARLPEGVWSFLAGFTPISGIALAAQPPTGSADIIRIAALIPAVILPLVFNNLVVRMRRRLDDALGTAKPPASRNADEIFGSAAFENDARAAK